MVEPDSPEPPLTNILKAASDPTRRAILTLLAQHGPTRVTDLARHFDMSLNAVSKHIKVLQAAGLTTRVTQWREHLIAADMAPIQEIDRWFRDLRSIWDQRLEHLETLLTKGIEMDDTPPALTLTARRTIKAPAKRIYDAWLDPAVFAALMALEGKTTTSQSQGDARVGGRFSIMVNTGDKEVPHAGTYLQMTPCSLIQFTWESPYVDAGSTVTITLTPTGDATEVALTHVKFRSEGSRDGHAAVWALILAKAESLLA